jgi:cation:H+ antiporter
VSSLAAIALLIVGIGLVIAGAELLLDGLLASAGRLGVPAFALIVLISGFELENLAAGIAANAEGLPGAAAGTFLGGATFLALGVAGIGAVIAPIRAELPRSALIWTAAAPLPLLALSLGGAVSRLDGALLILWFAIAILGLARSGGSKLGADDEAVEASRRRRPWIPLLGGLAILTAGGDLLAQALRDVVDRLGVSQTLLGNTVIAASVEGEEVARVAVPTRRGRGDLALGNITGTIVHFISFNAGVIALVKPLALDDATRCLHLPVAVASTAVLCGLLWLRKGITRGAGVALLGLYAAYIAGAVVVS